MFPSLSLLTGMVTGLAAKLGIAYLQRQGHMPQSVYVNRALKALEKDDLDEAVRNYRLAASRKRIAGQTEIAYEIISQAIMLRIGKLQQRLAEIDAVLNPPLLSLRYLRNLLPRRRAYLESLRREQEGFEGAIKVLEGMRAQLDTDRDP
ncbi:MAG: hypothetical protein QM372_11060 [Bacillota bacterium]|jgi:hypothetical protein|nr:hypothetical protein [Bacillota bacterium]